MKPLKNINGELTNHLICEVKNSAYISVSPYFSGLALARISLAVQHGVNRNNRWTTISVAVRGKISSGQRKLDVNHDRNRAPMKP